MNSLFNVLTKYCERKRKILFHEGRLEHLKFNLPINHYEFNVQPPITLGVVPCPYDWDELNIIIGDKESGTILTEIPATCNVFPLFIGKTISIAETGFVDLDNKPFLVKRMVSFIGGLEVYVEKIVTE